MVCTCRYLHQHQQQQQLEAARRRDLPQHTEKAGHIHRMHHYACTVSDLANSLHACYNPSLSRHRSSLSSSRASALTQSPRLPPAPERRWSKRTRAWLLDVGPSRAMDAVQAGAARSRLVLDDTYLSTPRACNDNDIDDSFSANVELLHRCCFQCWRTRSADSAAVDRMLVMLRDDATRCR